MLDHTVFELRRYRLRKGARESLIDLFDRDFVETQEAEDLDDPDAFVWVRSFANMEARTRSLSAFYTGPVWKAHGPVANATMVNSDNVLLLRPDKNHPVFAARKSKRPDADATAIPPGLFIITICSLAPNTEAQFAADFDRTARPLLVEAGARIDATFVTERSVNGYPNLPVREGETVFVWFASFADEQAYANYLKALSRSKLWSEEVFPSLDKQLWRPMEISRLTPTARSQLSW
jgi:hypothetical protein